jgi:MFS family permease
LPATFAIIGDRLPQNRRAIGFGVQSIIKRLPKVIAPPVGGWLIWKFGMLSGFRTALLATIVLGLLAMFVQYRFYDETIHEPRKENRVSAKRCAN